MEENGAVGESSRKDKNGKRLDCVLYFVLRFTCLLYIIYEGGEYSYV